MQTLSITPCPAPRMVHSDRWKKRPPVMRYFAFKKHLQLLRPEVNWDCLSIMFVLPMPKSWSEKKKKLHVGTPHKSRPDLDNLVKSFCDSLLGEDSMIWRYGEITKMWGRDGLIILDPQPLSLDQYQKQQL